MSRAGRIDAAEVARIAAMDDRPILRNLLITQGYHDLSQQLADIVGTGNASWATYGCWASKTAGIYIRGDELPGFLRDAVKHETGHKHAAELHDTWKQMVHAIEHPIETVVSLAGQISEDTSLYIKQGNKVVFAELADAFARFIETFADRDFTDAKLHALLDRWDTGPTQGDKVSIDPDAGTITSTREGGQSYLREMLTGYYRAAQEPDPDTKAELMMLANAYGGLHEQTRLQPYIVGSLDAPIDELLDARLRSEVSKQHPAHEGALHKGLERAGRPFVAWAERAFQQVASTLMMQMRLPDATINLGEDLTNRPGTTELYPAALRTITNQELAATLDRYGVLHPKERATGLRWLLDLWHALLARIGGRREVAGTAAGDWADFEQRMRFILAYFRVYQQDPALYQDPFTSVQLADMHAGNVPAGPL